MFNVQQAIKSFHKQSNMYAHDREIRQKIMYKSSDLILYPIIRAEFSFKMTAISRSSKDNGGLGSLVHYLELNYF